MSKSDLQVSESARESKLMIGAEWELRAFARAVQELFGPEEALRSVNDWLEELESMSWPTDIDEPDWRRVTVAASARLSARINAATHAEGLSTKR